MNRKIIRVVKRMDAAGPAGYKVSSAEGLFERFEKGSVPLFCYDRGEELGGTEGWRKGLDSTLSSV
jgi:hypothetical protein